MILPARRPWLGALLATACALSTLGLPSAAAASSGLHPDAAGSGTRPNAGCTLVIAEHRSERALVRVPWPTRTLRVDFVHSVLGTQVEDLYQWRGQAWQLVEERFRGQGYGLPHAAAEGERWVTEGDTTRLLLNRTVMPLVIRALPQQGMRVQLDDGPSWRLADLSPNAVQLIAQDC